MTLMQLAEDFAGSEAVSPERCSGGGADLPGAVALALEMHDW